MVQSLSDLVVVDGVPVGGELGWGEVAVAHRAVGASLLSTPARNGVIGVADVIAVNLPLILVSTRVAIGSTRSADRSATAAASPPIAP